LFEWSSLGRLFHAVADETDDDEEDRNDAAPSLSTSGKNSLHTYTHTTPPSPPHTHHHTTTTQAAMAKPALDLDALKGLDLPLQLLLALGALGVARFLLGAVYAVYKYFLRPGKNLRKLGSWAVVTGATGATAWLLSSLLLWGVVVDGFEWDGSFGGLQLLPLPSSSIK
jgi:hypothetical protein